MSESRGVKQRLIVVIYDRHHSEPDELVTGMRVVPKALPPQPTEKQARERCRNNRREIDCLLA